jgi:hypothetical protein
MGFGETHYVAGLGQVLRDQVRVQLGDPRMAVTEDATEEEEVRLRRQEVRRLRVPRLVRSAPETRELHQARLRVVGELVETLGHRPLVCR